MNFLESGNSENRVDSGISAFPIKTCIREFLRFGCSLKIPDFGNSEIQKKLKEVESDLTVGRVLVRPSGTESKIRIMVESDDEITAKKYAKDIAQMFKK